MVVWTRLRQISAVAASAGTGALIYKLFENQDKSKVQASWTQSDQPVNPCAVWDRNWDFQDPKSLVRPMRDNSAAEENRYNSELEMHRPIASRNIILVRHGEYLDMGVTDDTHKLTERGREQAKYTGERLRELGIKWDKVIASTMTRARETMEIILKEINLKEEDVTFCNFIREGAPIPPQPPVGHWKPEKSQFFRDGARIEAGFRRHFYRASPDEKCDTYTLIVGHANVIRYFVCRALQLPPEAWLRINLNHGSITWLCIGPSGNVSIKYLGESGYMPPQFLTNRIPRKGIQVV